MAQGRVMTRRGLRRVRRTWSPALAASRRNSAGVFTRWSFTSVTISTYGLRPFSLAGLPSSTSRTTTPSRIGGGPGLGGPQGRAVPNPSAGTQAPEEATQVGSARPRERAGRGDARAAGRAGGQAPQRAAQTQQPPAAGAELDAGVGLEERAQE